MHYKNGREAKVGDQVVSKDAYGNASGGVLVKANAASTTCNGQILPNSNLNNLSYVNLSDCLLVEDAFAVPAPAEDPVKSATV